MEDTTIYEMYMAGIMISNFTNCDTKWRNNFSVYQSPLTGLLRHKFQTLSSEFPMKWVWREAQVFPFLTNS